MTTYLQDAAEILDYTLDWQGDTPVLETGETIITSTWGAVTGLTLSAASHTDTTTTVWVSGGTDGERYALTNTITTSAGRTYERWFSIRVEAIKV